jgi:hypothetical protein
MYTDNDKGTVMQALTMSVRSSRQAYKRVTWLINEREQTAFISSVLYTMSTVVAAYEYTGVSVMHDVQNCTPK